ncbi:MAG: DUF805 domain-containing protein [Azovibrio sp.]
MTQEAHPPANEQDKSPEGIDTTFKLNLLSPTGRIGRMRYFSFSILLLVLFSLGIAGLKTMTLFQATPWLFFIPLTALFCLELILGIKRCHDFNAPGWWALLLMLPLLGNIPLPMLQNAGLPLFFASCLFFITFFFIPGTKGPNNFGSATAPNDGPTQALFMIALIFTALIIFGLAPAFIAPHSG